jgi:hypothetical protein
MTVTVGETTLKAGDIGLSTPVGPWAAFELKYCALGEKRREELGSLGVDVVDGEGPSAAGVTLKRYCEGPYWASREFGDMVVVLADA